MRRAALIAIVLLAGCGGHAPRHDGPIVYGAGNGYRAVDANGLHVRRVPLPGLVSPDGSARLLQDGRLVAGGRATRLLEPGDAADAEWSPDGRTIAYVHAWSLWTV